MSALFRERQSSDGATADRPVHARTVRDVMTAPVFTVREDDRICRAAGLMDWKHVRHVPVDRDGYLVGLVTYRTIIQVLAESRDGGEGVAVRDIMRTGVVTVAPKVPILDAMALMRRGGLGCLPVVEHRRLVGIVTQSDLVSVSTDLLMDWLRES